MPVDPIEGDGFSVLREMDFFSGGDLRYTVTEGLFKDGKLNGLGTVYYDSNVNGYHSYRQRTGIFKDGEFIFGYSNRFENTGGKQPPTYFGYADGRDIKDYGKEIIYEGRRYIGKERDGVPNGIGCLFTDGKNMLVGGFEDGKIHGIGATYRLIDDKWCPYDLQNDRPDPSFYASSLGLYLHGELRCDLTLESFYCEHGGVEKI